MNHADERLAAGYTLEQQVEIAAMTSGDDYREAVDDDGGTPFESIIDEIDAWARHALAANGFGDY